MTNLRIWGNVKVTYSRHWMLLHTAWSLLGQVPMHPHYAPPSKPTSLWSRYMMTWQTLWKRMLAMVTQQWGYSVPLSTGRLWWKWSRPTSVHIHSYLDTHTLCCRHTRMSYWTNVYVWVPCHPWLVRAVGIPVGEMESYGQVGVVGLQHPDIPILETTMITKSQWVPINIRYRQVTYIYTVYLQVFWASSGGALRRVGGEEQELKDGEVLIVRCRSVYVQVYVLYNIPNILSSTATASRSSIHIFSNSCAHWWCDAQGIRGAGEGTWGIVACGCSLKVWVISSNSFDGIKSSPSVSPSSWMMKTMPSSDRVVREQGGWWRPKGNSAKQKSEQ